MKEKAFNLKKVHLNEGLNRKKDKTISETLSQLEQSRITKGTGKKKKEEKI